MNTIFAVSMLLASWWVIWHCGRLYGHAESMARIQKLRAVVGRLNTENALLRAKGFRHAKEAIHVN